MSAGAGVAAAPPAVQAPASAAGLRGLHPAYFALVMATGIVSLACAIVGWPLLAASLFALNVAFYAGLWALLTLRALRHRDALLADLVSHGRAPGFLTAVAATSVLGSQSLLIGRSFGAASALWVVAIALWAVLTYGVFTMLTVKPAKPTLAEGINGGWLVAVVAAQSVAVLGAQLAPGFGARAPDVLLFCLAMWLGGGMLYIWIISLIFYRYTFFTMQPSDLTPPYWINMGAVAISTLAGATLANASPSSPLVAQLLPFVKGLTLLFWATATWWIPMLVILGVWRHVYAKLPLRYDPLYWGAVFPLGMYAVATFRLAAAIETPGLVRVTRLFTAIALAAWAATFLGLARQLVRAARPAPGG